jgi:hypothetical protein
MFEDWRTVQWKLSGTDLTPSYYYLFTFFFSRYDHQERLSAKEAMAHAYFAPVREAAVRGATQASAGSNYAV